MFVAGLAHCRHLRTVRTHLSGLVHPAIISEEESAKNGLTEEKWREMFNEDVVGVTDKTKHYPITHFLINFLFLKIFAFLSPLNFVQKKTM